jgi:hypothetical protein
MQFRVACDYRKLFEDRVIYLTGVGRSGTTILGKVFSSMRPTYYLFEPALMRWFGNNDLLSVCKVAKEVNVGLNENTLQMFRGILFEDYFLPQIHGRVNPNPYDWTCGTNAFTKKELVHRWTELRRRKDAMKFIDKEDPWWIIKNPEALSMAPILNELFPNCTIINIIRNGKDVIRSAMERQWFSDKWCNTEIIDWVEDGKVGIPWYIDEDGKEDWHAWNAITRSACMWRCLSDTAYTDTKNTIRYEEFCEDPQFYVDYYSERFGLEVTPKTIQHIYSIEKHDGGNDPEVDFSLIYEPEKTRFIETMTKLGYEV